MPNAYTVLKTNESRWGALYTPLKPKKEKEGLSTVLFVSCNSGNLLLKNLALYEAIYPEKLNIVGVVTDDPIDPEARISIKKRVWKQFTPQERSNLFNQTIDFAANLGVPCYSGAVKNAWFHDIFRSWAPEALLMLCFGQKIDAALFGFPLMGSYNFHPSDLQKKIGAGSQPFENTIKKGQKTSPLVIHEVTNVIDRGPIIGVSPQVNICLEDGSYPASILTLDDKITSLGGWMGVELIDTIIARKAAGEKGSVGEIDFIGKIPQSIKAILSKPAVNDLNEKYVIPRHPLLNNNHPA
ncbi:MAG TPA: hypothetical protein DEO70_05395 [Bacteroidales bacterium]|nr:MAG: hypothetical protein A2X11_16705 [Bacteroidetes bacterium GWE2_42_24]OFY25132.1 MAG: hypothetical protein A2X09_04865 [Bacteroidetes bacterium GWF2_43_11]HBZ66253.1 hypothetical protein [Bacteroidales bacterium]